MNRLLGFFVLSILFAIIFSNGFDLDNVFAANVQVSSKSFSFENTTIIQFTNEGTEKLKSFRIWLTDISFKSFKSENGWTAQKLPQIIIFTAVEPIKPGEIVKFGIKTDKPKPDINWKAIDIEGNQIDTGKTLADTAQSLSVDKEETIEQMPGILSESTFRIIPENPKVGSTIRVTGDDFAQKTTLELYLFDDRLKSFETDEDGHFMLTMKIPQKQKAERVNFIIKDNLGNDKIINVQIDEKKEKITLSTKISLTVSEIPDQFNADETFMISGETHPDRIIIAKIKNSQGKLLSSETEHVDSEGQWSFSYHILPDATLSDYSLEITDGKDTIIKSWSVVLAKDIQISPTKLKFKVGEPLKFNGTANPDETIDIILEDPKQNIVLVQSIIVKRSGIVEIEYPTQPSSLEGTYVLFVFQDKQLEIAIAGLGEFPRNKLAAKMDKLNYNIGDVATIGITGQSSENLELLIIDQSEKNWFSETLHLGIDGKINYELNMTEFPPGIYTTVISLASYQTTEPFTVGLPTGTIQIDLEFAKKVYSPGQSILVIGKSAPNIIINLFLIDPDGILVQKKESFTNQRGEILMKDLNIPHDATFGKWIIRAESGSQFANIEFPVDPSEEIELWVRATEIFSTTIGKYVTLEGFGLDEQIIKITIIDPEGNNISETQVRSTKDGQFSLFWTVPEDAVSGTYTVVVEAATGDTANTSFAL